MTTKILSSNLNEKFELIRDLLQKSISLTERCSDTAGAKLLINRLATLQSASLFVIVGEVKSGKSSFVNALLRENICEVAPDPCTAVIQELVYGEERTKIILGENWERVTLPKEILKEITIVDTPGTNSIISNQQVITEKYIPQSDMVVFVFPAKNPHVATAWDLLSLIRKDWYRKIVFILQQTDLVTQGELNTNKSRVEQYARERNVQNPRVFSVSAKRELEGAADSGYAEFRAFLRNAVETGEVWTMKVESARNIVLKIIGNLLTNLKSEQTAIADDKAFYEKLIAIVNSRRSKANSLGQLAVDSLCDSYNRLADKLEKDFAKGLEIGTILHRSIPFVRDKNVKEWLDELELDFKDTVKNEIHNASSRVSKDISNEVKSIFNELTESISNHQNSNSKFYLYEDFDRVEILSRLKQNLEDLRISNIVSDEGIKGTDIGNLTLTGGGIAVLGTVFALTTQLLILDITGGILTAAGVGLMAVNILWKRGRILKDFQNKIRLSRDEFRGRLNKEITQIFEKLFFEPEHRLNESISNLNTKCSQLDQFSKEAEELMQRAETILFNQQQIESAAREDAKDL